MKWAVSDYGENASTCSFQLLVNAYVGVGTLQEGGISIFPNPTKGLVNLEFANDNIQHISISDILGEKIFEKTAVSQNETIDLSSFEQGVYFIAIQSDKEVFSSIIVKE